MTVAETTRSLPHMLGRRVLGVLGASGLAFVLLVEPLQEIEAALARQLAGVFGVRTLQLSGASTAIVGSETHVADLTASCSSAAAIIAVVTLAILLRRAPAVVRARSAVGATVFLLVTNVIRVGFAFIAAAHWGRTGLVVLHEWLGPVVTVVSFATAVAWTIRRGSTGRGSETLSRSEPAWMGRTVLQGRHG
jgi:exosortase/archaeosortase family protein